MRRLILTLGAALMLAAAPALAQQTKTVNGTLTEIAANSITVQVDGKDMKFSVDPKTEVTAPKGSTTQRAAAAAGKGVTVADVLKTGQAVEVRYDEQSMRAASIRAIASVPPKPGPKAQTATGMVSAVSGNSVTVKGSSSEWTFTVDDKTTITGSGLGTASRKMESEGKKPNLAELIKEGDTVSVTYREDGGTMHASVIRITKRKM
jgi:hypothetical protein